MTISGPSTSYLPGHFPVTEDTRTASSTASKASSALLALVAGCSAVVALSASNIPVPQDGARIQLWMGFMKPYVKFLYMGLPGVTTLLIAVSYRTYNW